MKKLAILVALALIGGSTSARAQHAARDSALAGKLTQESDTIKKDKSRPLYVERSRLRILKIADSLRAGKPDTIRIVRVDTVRIKDSTIITPPPPPPAQQKLTIAIHSNGTSVNVGGTLQLIGQATDSTGADVQKTIVWSITEGTAFATVSSTGLLTGVKGGGVATVKAQVDTFFITRAYTVIGGIVDTTSKPDTTTPPVVVTPGGGGATLTHPFAPPSNGAAFAELPRKQVDVSYPATTNTIRVPSGADLQAVLDNAPAGSNILLVPGSSYSGNFIGSKNNCPNWTVIRTDISDASLGAQGTRMSPSRASTLNLAKLLAMFNQGAFGTKEMAGAGCYRLVGVEVAEAPGANDANGLVRFGDELATSIAMQAHDLIIDRSYIHGSRTGQIRRCVVLNSANSAIVDSYLSDCNSLNGDSQCILGYNGPGPFLIDNIHCEGGTEVIMWGGADPKISGLVPCDIIISNSDITRDPRDKTSGLVVVKNLLETKNVCRLLVQNNRIFNNWAQGQTGFGILLKSVNQDGACPWCVSKDITIRNNKFWNSGNGINLANIMQGPAQPASRFSIYNNYIDSLNVGIYFGQGIPFQVLSGPLDLILMHNTLRSGEWGLLMFDGESAPRFVMTNNILWCGGFGIHASNFSGNVAGWTGSTINGLWQDNAMWGTGCTGGYPTNSTYQESWQTITDPKYGVTP
jgi:hypothetical protein